MSDKLQDIYTNTIDSVIDADGDLTNIVPTMGNNLTELLVESALNEKQNQIYQTRAKSGGASCRPDGARLNGLLGRRQQAQEQQQHIHTYPATGMEA